MSRVLKFRLWHVPDNGWAKGMGRMSREFFLRSNGEPVPDGINFSGETILMQYTGLKDAHGVEIYEGDILKHLGPVRSIPLPPFVMQWDEERAGWVDYDREKAFAVIGNVHENPELLERAS